MTASYSKPCNPPVPREVRLHHDHKAEAISQRSRRGAEKRVFPSLSIRPKMANWLCSDLRPAIDHERLCRMGTFLHGDFDRSVGCRTQRRRRFWPAKEFACEDGFRVFGGRLDRSRGEEGRKG